MTKFVIILLSVFTFYSCSILHSSIVTPNITNTTWHYVDEDKEYDITFAENGKLINTNPADTTPENDTWEQKGNTIKFYFNDKYVKYTGTIQGNTITGSAKNSVNKTWDFKMTIVK